MDGQGALLIALQRPDLVRTDDIALRHAIQVQYGLHHLPKPDEVAALARRWSPYGSLASSLLLATARPNNKRGSPRIARPYQAVAAGRT